MAFKEKRPQYNINPPPIKESYGIIGMIPLVLFQSILLTLKLPEDLQVKALSRLCRTAVLVVKTFGRCPVHYIAFAVLIVIAGLGYYAGFKEFYLVSFIKEKLGINKRKPIIKNENL